MDVDGVITNLKNKKANPQMLQYLYQQLKKGTFVVLNTGRSLDAVIQKVINPLTKDKSDNSFLENLFVVGEKGGTWMVFDENGAPQEHVDESIFISSNLQKRYSRSYRC